MSELSSGNKNEVEILGEPIDFQLTNSTKRSVLQQFERWSNSKNGLEMKPLNELIELFIADTANNIEQSGFLEAVEETRINFSHNMLGDDWWVEVPTEKRVQIENILIMYDQMNERLENFREETERLFNSVIAWQGRTFGYGRPALFPANHLQKEVAELKEALEIQLRDPDPKRDREVRKEIADCFLLLMNLCSNYGLTWKQVLNVIQQKLEINMKRKWGKANEDGVIEHIKEEGNEDGIPNSL